MVTLWPRARQQQSSKGGSGVSAPSASLGVRRDSECGAQIFVKLDPSLELPKSTRISRTRACVMGRTVGHAATPPSTRRRADLSGRDGSGACSDIHELLYLRWAVENS